MPPGWLDRTHTVGYGTVHMPGVSAGLVTAADVNTQPNPRSSSMDSPASWATLWFALSVVYLVGIYYGMLHVRSSAM
jgi:hypothetical protein